MTFLFYIVTALLCFPLLVFLVKILSYDNTLLMKDLIGISFISLMPIINILALMVTLIIIVYTFFFTDIFSEKFDFLNKKVF